jgi:hypothetical protein
LEIDLPLRIADKTNQRRTRYSSPCSSLVLSIFFSRDTQKAEKYFERALSVAHQQ